MSIRRIATTAFLTALPFGACPALAQQDYSPPMADEKAQTDDGLSLIERGMGMIFRNLLEDVGPDLNSLGQNLSGALSRMAPVLQDLSVLVDDLGNYQPPERLENGDIVIRRKPGAPPPPPIGDSLRDFSEPGDPAEPGIPRDPYSPEIEL
ncbi:hypothetical protein [Paracoccus salsus]|uniref:hypothetical protein n=1 Tax=Paracoccus salsus TaxID=2911061 RepID=UPI001F20C435|nr:hypothetical protein [Paracoccus salsus]MCF3974564.1 hypothetical protein [Paracoccus salsus]